MLAGKGDRDIGRGSSSGSMNSGGKKKNNIEFMCLEKWETIEEKRAQSKLNASSPRLYFLERRIKHSEWRDVFILG